MKILVTGASGFVGGAFWRRAQRAGHDVTGLGRRPLDDPHYIVCDLAEGLPAGLWPDAVVHAAARSSPWGRKRDFVAQNVAATRNVVAFCESHGRPLLLHVSSCAVMYENRHQLSMDELHPLPERPINAYAATKREAEEVVRAYAGPWCIVRPRAVFGPGDTVVFPRILTAAKAGRLPWIESSQQVLGDLIYIDTLTDYLLQIIEQGKTGLYLLTNNEPVAMLDFLGLVLGRLGLPAPRRRVPANRAMRAAAVIESLYAALPFLGEPPLTRFGVSVFAYSKTFNVAKALRELGPPAVPLGEGVERFVQWQRQNPL